MHELQTSDGLRRNGNCVCANDCFSGCIIIRLYQLHAWQQYVAAVSFLVMQLPNSSSLPRLTCVVQDRLRLVNIFKVPKSQGSLYGRYTQKTLRSVHLLCCRVTGNPPARSHYTCRMIYLYACNLDRLSPCLFPQLATWLRSLTIPYHSAAADIHPIHGVSEPS